MYHQNTENLFILNIFSDSFTSSQSSLTRWPSQLLSHYFPEGNFQIPSKTLPLLIPEKKDVHVAVPLSILAVSSPFALVAHLQRWHCSSNFPTVLTQPLSHTAFGDCAPYSTLAMTLPCSQGLVVLCVWHIMGHYQCPCSTKVGGINTTEYILLLPFQVTLWGYCFKQNTYHWLVCIADLSC